MSFEGGNLDTALAAAVGDDPVLIHDLRRAFLESADRQIDLLSRARDEAAWQQALWRLKGLCGSFGVIGMITMVEQAEQGPACDAKSLNGLRAALAMLSVG